MAHGLVALDESPAVAARFGIMSIPTLIVFKNGAPVQQFVGVQSEETLVQSLTTA